MKLRRTRIALAALAASTLPGALGIARAQEKDRISQLTYAVYAHGIRVLVVEAQLRLTPDAYSVVVRDHTAGFLSFMVHTDVTSIATGRFTPAGIDPVHFESAGYSRGARRQTVIDYADGNPTIRLLTPSEPNRDPIDIKDASGSIDTLAAMAELVHEVRTAGTCDGHALIFDGLRLTRASAHGAGEQTVPADDRSHYGGRALRCDFVSQEIGGFLHDDEAAKMHLPQHGSAWVASVLPGGLAIPVRITFENPKLGPVTMILTHAAEAAAGPPATRASL